MAMQRLPWLCALVLAILFAAVPARADGLTTSPAGTGAGGCPLSGCTMSGQINANGGLNTTSSAGLQIGGATVFNYQGSSVLCGPGAGAAFSNVTEALACGYDSQNILTGTNLENTTVGWNTLANCLSSAGANCNFITLLGDGNLWWETLGTADTLTGADSGKDQVGSEYLTCSGAYSCALGASIADVAQGYYAILGNSSAILNSGTGTNGDSVSLLFHCTGATCDYVGNDQTVVVNFTTGETPAQMAAAEVTAINANGLIHGADFGATQADYPPSTVYMSFPGTQPTGWAVTITPTLTGSASETITASGGYAGNNNIALGQKSFSAEQATTAQFNVSLGPDVLQSTVTAAYNFCGIIYSCRNLAAGTNNIDIGQEGAAQLNNAGSVIGFGAFNLYDDLSSGNNIVFVTGAANTSQGDEINSSGWLYATNNIPAPGGAANGGLFLGGTISGDTDNVNSGIPHVCAVGVECIIASAQGVNFNATGDVGLTVTPVTSSVHGYLPLVTKYVITALWVDGCTAASSSAEAGLYTAASAGGTAIVLNTQTWAGATSAANSMQEATLTPAVTTQNFTGTTLYFNRLAASGSANTCNIHVGGRPYVG